MSRIQGKRVTNALLGRLQASLLLLDEAKTVVGFIKVRLEGDCPTKAGCRLRETPPAQLQQTEAEDEIGVSRLDRHGLQTGRLGFIKAFHPVEQQAEIVPGIGVRRLKRDCSPITRLRVGRISLFVEQSRQVVEGLREVGSQGYCRLVCCLGFRSPVPSLEDCTQVVLDQRILSIQGQGMPIAGFGLGQPAGVLQGIAEIAVRLRVTRHQSHCFLQGDQSVLALRIQCNAQHLPEKASFRVAGQQATSLRCEGDEIALRVEACQSIQFNACRLSHRRLPWLPCISSTCPTGHPRSFLRSAWRRAAGRRESAPAGRHAVRSGASGPG